jgi:hypothetical protein
MEEDVKMLRQILDNLNVILPGYVMVQLEVENGSAQ